MECLNCLHWLTLRVTDYEDGTRITNFKSPDGKGHCGILNFDTDADFGCNKFVEGHEHIEIMAKKTGSPWHHSHYITCPDCKGAGVINDGGCGRCARTGRCLLYDDGHVGEESTRRHPNEEKTGPPPKPTCSACSHEIERSWKACPFCGNRFAESEIVRVSEIL
jgi:hypothetical protein